MTRILCLCLATTALAATTAAAGPPMGPYFGGTLGYSLGDAETNIPAYAPSQFYSNDVDGLQGGLFIGFNNSTAAGVIYGVEAGANILATEDTHATSVANETFTTEGDWEVSLVGRAGSVMGNYYVYGLAGVSHMEVSGSYSGFTSQSDGQTGYVVGIGAERDIAGGFLRGEVRYADYDTFDLQCSTCGPTFSDISTLTVLVGFGRAF